MVRFGVAIAALACMAASAVAQESTEQLKKELEQLRAEVEGLKAVNQSKEIPATTAKVDADAMAADDHPVMTMFKGTKLSGFVDAGYEFSFNQLNTNRGTRGVNNNNPVRIFDRQDNSFYLHEAHIQLERLASKDMIVGYHIELAAGHDPGLYDGAQFDLQEGWVQIMAPLGSGLDIRVGKMATLVGFEVLENINNMNYSRGMLFGLLQPFTNTGVRAAYGMGGANNDMVTFTLGFNNGLNNGDLFADNLDHGKDFEFQVALKPMKDVSIATTVIVGGDELSTGNLSRHKHYVWDITGSYTMDKLTVALNFDERSDQGGIGARRASFSGIALYGKYQWTDAMGSALRVEYFSDHDGFFAGLGPKTGADSGTGSRVFEFTITQEIKIAQQLIVRIEIRHDDSNNHDFLRNDKRSRGDNTLGAEVIMPF